MKQYQFWFIVGSQFLYGTEVLDTVAKRAAEMAEKLPAVLPYPLVYTVTAKSSQEISETIKKANYDESCAGVITWCHTFSPSKMWINGLSALQKPYCHLATQYNREIPNKEIDMDFMNLLMAIGNMALSRLACGCPEKSLPAIGRTRTYKNASAAG